MEAHTGSEMSSSVGIQIDAPKNSGVKISLYNTEAVSSTDVEDEQRRCSVPLQWVMCNSRTHGEAIGLVDAEPAAQIK
jgi:hypothetical protein